MKKWLLAVAVLLIGLFAYRFSQIKKTGKEVLTEQKVPVETMTTSRDDLWNTVELTGDVRGYLEARVFPKVPGKVSERTKSAGDRVKANETVLTVDRDEPALEYALAEVRSPLSGIITRYHADRGESVSPQSPVAEVATIDRVKVTVNVPEKDMALIRTGQKALFTVDVYPERTFEGTVTNVSRSLDSLARTLTVEITADNADEALRPGMFARVSIRIEKHEGAITIPRSALIFTPGSDPIVYVVEDGVARPRSVRTGLERTDVVEITDGLAEGVRVVTVGQYNLSDGSKVSVVSETADDAGVQTRG